MICIRSIYLVGGLFLFLLLIIMSILIKIGKIWLKSYIEDRIEDEHATYPHLLHKEIFKEFGNYTRKE